MVPLAEGPGLLGRASLAKMPQADFCGQVHPGPLHSRLRLKRAPVVPIMVCLGFYTTQPTEGRLADRTPAAAP